MAVYDRWTTPEGILRISGWARDGLSVEQIAQNIGIRKNTLYAWKNRFPKIAKAIDEGREVVDLQVENALLKRALGYDYEEVTQETGFDKESGKKILMVRRVVNKHVQPDVTAQIFWLKNRRPEKWRDRKDLSISEMSAEQSRLADTLQLLQMDDERAEAPPEPEV